MSRYTLVLLNDLQSRDESTADSLQIPKIASYIAAGDAVDVLDTEVPDHSLVTAHVKVDKASTEYLDEPMLYLQSFGEGSLLSFFRLFAFYCLFVFLFVFEACE